MANISAQPTSINLGSGNGQAYLSWNPVAGAISYSVQRSTDGVTFNVIANPTEPYFLDSTVSYGDQYWYSVASTTSVGTSGYGTPTPTNTVICAPGQINLGYIRYLAQDMADMLTSAGTGSGYISQNVWNAYINNSMMELYGLLVTEYGSDYFLAPPLILTTSGQISYPLPNGMNYPVNGSNAPATFKVYGVDLNSYGANINNATGWFPMSRFNWADRNKYNWLLGAASNNVAGQYCQFQYREMGSDLYVLPINSGQNLRLWYVPLPPQLLQDTDMVPFSFAAWYQYIVIDAAIKASGKQEFYTRVASLKQDKEAMMIRIMDEAKNRDVGQPNTSTNSRSNLGDPNFGGGPFGNGAFGGFGGGSGGGFGY